jgi:hypothetical protein
MSNQIIFVRRQDICPRTYSEPRLYEVFSEIVADIAERVVGVTRDALGECSLRLERDGYGCFPRR